MKSFVQWVTLVTLAAFGGTLALFICGCLSSRANPQGDGGSMIYLSYLFGSLSIVWTVMITLLVVLVGTLNVALGRVRPRAEARG